MSFNWFNFINTNKRQILGKDNRRVITVSIAKDSAVRTFTNELLKIPSDLFYVSQEDIGIYVDELKKIKDFEEGNMKMYAYCFLISRSFNYDYELINNSYVKIQEIASSIFKQFNGAKDNLFGEFQKDIYINCFTIIRTRLLNSSTKEDVQEYYGEMFEEGEIDRRDDLFYGD